VRQRNTAVAMPHPTGYLPTLTITKVDAAGRTRLVQQHRLELLEHTSPGA
jgi:hypothetical protein